MSVENNEKGWEFVEDRIIKSQNLFGDLEFLRDYLKIESPRVDFSDVYSEVDFDIDKYVKEKCQSFYSFIFNPDPNIPESNFRRLGLEFFVFLINTLFEFFLLKYNALPNNVRGYFYDLVATGAKFESVFVNIKEKLCFLEDAEDIDAGWGPSILSEQVVPFEEGFVYGDEGKGGVKGGVNGSYQSVSGLFDMPGSDSLPRHDVVIERLGDVVEGEVSDIFRVVTSNSDKDEGSENDGDEDLANQLLEVL